MSYLFKSSFEDLCSYKLKLIKLILYLLEHAGIRPEKIKPNLINRVYIHSSIQESLLNHWFVVSRVSFPCPHLIFARAISVHGGFEGFEIGIFSMGYFRGSRNYLDSKCIERFETSPYKHSTHLNMLFFIKICFHFFFYLLSRSMKSSAFSFISTITK